MKIKLTCSLFFLCFSAIPVFAQPAKKTTTIVKKKSTVKPVVKKTTTVKRTTTVKTVKPAVKKTKVVVKPVVKAKPVKPVKPPVNYNVSLADLHISDREMQMVNEINLVRSNPSGYVKYVTAYLKATDDVSKTMKAAATELTKELKKMQPLPALKLSPVLYIDAREFGKELLETNTIQHSRLPYAENLSFGIENVRDVIITLLIDEVSDDRGHRKNIFKRNASLVAVHEIPGKVEDFPFCYIQEFK